ncbi:hypothetical protein CHGG_01564 [Chaetomium globosum CBS 148.51]|uniref:F-box domain-containing protein n=1 Tax=Chaetomium globosum (strain ATCC 6205 / CBS 148.51 / DSM 1962 / NBRC 6347 / NRRL 1970) TaxID=306901 RepID=Q2HDZ0_CHAGB|nr:uncharacterized protein CHGG_01564 [Chaetomium globosum CBS 148.51]EAQ93329.1 hypothetical protein CHGG_01564 [Chaetomium globosum CBS 148.51]
MYFKAAVLFSLLASSIALPMSNGDRKVKRGVLTVQDYADFQVSSGVAGDALAEVNAKFPIDQSDFASVDAEDLAIIKAARETAEAAETQAGGFNEAIEAAGGKNTPEGQALQAGKIKNKVLKLQLQVLALQIEAAQGKDTAEKLAKQQKKLDKNVKEDEAAAGQTKPINMAVPGCPDCTSLDQFTDPLVAAVLHNCRHIPIARLPEDILLHILDYFDQDLAITIFLRQVSRQFRRLVLRRDPWDISRSGNDGGTMQGLVRVNRGYGLKKRSALHKKAPHAKYEFPKRGRGSICYGIKGFVRVCRHKQISWSQIEALIAQVRYDGSDFVHFKKHCKHPSHRRCPGSTPPQFRFQWYVGGTVQRMVRRENVPIYLHLWWESHSRVNQLNLDGQGRLRAPFLRSLFRRTAMVRQPPLGAESDMGMSCFSHPQCRCVYYEIGNALGGSEAPTFENSVPDDTDDTSYIACLRKRPGLHQASSNRVNLERMSARLCAKPPCVPRDDGISNMTATYKLLAHFAVVVPVDVRNNPPPPGGMADLLAPEEQRDPSEQHGRRDGRHHAVCLQVASLGNPRVGVEGEQKPKQALERHDGRGDLPGHGAVGVDDVDERHVGALDDGKVYWLVS